MMPCHQNSVRGTCFSHGEVSPGIKMAKFHFIHIASSEVVLLCSNWCSQKLKNDVFCLLLTHKSNQGHRRYYEQKPQCDWNLTETRATLLCQILHQILFRAYSSDSVYTTLGVCIDSCVPQHAFGTFTSLDQPQMWKV